MDHPQYPPGAAVRRTAGREVSLRGTGANTLVYGRRATVLLAILLSTSCASAPPSHIDALHIDTADCYRDIEITAPPEVAETVCSRALGASSIDIQSFAFANLHLGEARLRSKSYDRAAEPLRLAAELFSGRAPDARRRALHGLAQSLSGSLKSSEAIAALDEALQLPGPRTHILFDRAEALLAIGRMTEASSDYRAVVAGARRTDPEERHLASRGSVRLGDLALLESTPESLQRAKEAFEGARRDDPDSPSAAVGLGRTSLALAAIASDGASASDHLSDALRAFELAERLAPQDFAPVAGSGRTLIRMGRQEEGARRLQRALELAPDNVSLLVEISRALAGSGRLAEAEAPLQRALALAPPDAALRVELARIQLSQDRTDDALASFEAAGRLDPGLASAFLGIGSILFNKGAAHFPAARTQLTEAERLASRSRDLPSRGAALYFLSRIETEGPAPPQPVAIRLADEAVSIDGRNGDYRAQACLARIRLLDKARAATSGDTSGVCAAAGAGSPAQAKLLSGLHQLRLAHFANGDDRKRRWESAYKSFSEGLEALGNPENDSGRQLRSRLEMGQGMSYYCIGFADIGRQMMERSDKEARAFFDTYHVARCSDY